MREAICIDGNKCTAVTLWTCACIRRAMAMPLRASAWEFCPGGCAFAKYNLQSMGQVKSE